MTREQIEAMRADVDCARPTECEVCEPIHAVLDMALAHLDSDRARRVGEAVIEVVGSDPVAPDGLDVMAHNMGAPNKFLPALLRAIAAALRGEP